MNDVVSTFPLFRLPKKAVLNTLRSMTHLEIYGISTLSKKAKHLVESLKLKIRPISVSVADVFEVHLEITNSLRFSFELYQVLENEPLQELETPANVYVQYAGNPWEAWTNLMSVKELLDHLQCIFHTSMNILYFGSDCERFSLESIQKNVENFQSICFGSENHEQNKRVLRFFQPADLFLLALDEGHIPRDISIQNFDIIRAPGVQISLDDLVMTNARSIHFTCDILSIKILNHFLKLWVKGSNPQLEFLFLRFRLADFQEEELLRGLKFKYAPRYRRRFFKASGRKEIQEVFGGTDIRRFDGTNATISFDISNGFIRFGLFVWHDHCIVN